MATLKTLLSVSFYYLIYQASAGTLHARQEPVPAIPPNSALNPLQSLSSILPGTTPSPVPLAPRQNVGQDPTINQQNGAALQNGQPGTAGSSGASPQPPGYNIGKSSQDHEPVNQTSLCSTTCPSSATIQYNAQKGPNGEYAAAVHPGFLGLGSSTGDICPACGKCFDVINSGIAAPNFYGGPSPQLATELHIRVWVTNECQPCALDQIDINEAPAGWDNPQIYYKPC